MRHAPLNYLMLLALAIFPWNQAIAQQTTQQQEPGWKTAKQISDAKEKRGEPAFTQYELNWEPIESHQDSTLKVSGKDYKFSQDFTDGEAPFFNAFEEELEPGKYFYSIDFIPNEIGEQKRALETLLTDRKDLLKRRYEAIESGKHDQAKSFLQRANDMREEASELQGSRMVIGEKQPFEFIKTHGQITVDENGVIKVFDLQKVRKAAREKAAEARKAERAEMGTEEEHEADNLKH